MSKIDDIRRQREAQFAQQQRESHQRASSTKREPSEKRPRLEVVPPLLGVEVVPANAANAAIDANDANDANDAKDAKDANAAKDAKAPDAKAVRKVAGQGQKSRADVQAKCPVCGKLKSIENGLVTSHQKGLGKMCPGSRKPA